MPDTKEKPVSPKWPVYQQSICEDCLQELVNGESGHTDKEANKMNETLNRWFGENYEPAGMNDDMESFFSWRRCDLCDQKAGNRYKYNFFDKSISKP
jgi:hypothetical protein